MVSRGTRRDVSRAAGLAILGLGARFKAGPTSAARLVGHGGRGHASLRADAPCCVEPESMAAPGTTVTEEGVAVTLSPLDGPAGPSTLAITVRDRRDRPVVDAMVYVVIRMPSMDHGESAYPAREATPGHYRATAVSLGMAGDWVVAVTVIRQGRPPVSVAYEVRVEER